MPKPVPSPVAAAVGLVPAVLGHVLRLPGKAVQVPVIAVSSALGAVDTARREYDELAARGERILARLWGSPDHDGEPGDVLSGPTTARSDRVEEAATDLAERAAAAGGAAVSLAAELFAVPTQPDGIPAADQPSGTDAAHDPLPGPDLPDAEAPKGQPTPKATEPDSTRIGTAASADVVRTVEQVSAAVGVDAVEDRAELPLDDYDHMTLGSLRGRLRSLDVDQLLAVRGYEKAHADRLPVVTMLDNRIAKLAATGGSPSATGATGTPRPEPGLRRTARAGTGSRPPTAARNDTAPHTPPRTKVRLT